MSDRLERPSRAGTGRDWLGTLAGSTGLLCLYFVAPFGQDDDPLPLAVATTLSVAVILVLAAMVSKRILRVLDGNTTDSLPVSRSCSPWWWWRSLLATSCSPGLILLKWTASTLGSTPCTSPSPRWRQLVMETSIRSAKRLAR